MTPHQALTHFLETFDIGGVVDGKVTREEFVNYYTNIGASIDNEDYFELMIRNAWHISGGEGAAANSANRRVLVTRADGSQAVEEIRNDLGLKAGDKAGMIARLRAQGSNASQIDLFGAGDDNKSAKGFGQRPSTAGASVGGGSAARRAAADSSVSSLTSAMSQASISTSAIATAGPKAGGAPPKPPSDPSMSAG